MIELLEKEYNIRISEFNKFGTGIVFYFAGFYYYFDKYDFDEEYINKMFNFSNSISIKKHEFVFNNENKISSDGFVLLKLNVIICDITLDDVYLFNSIHFFGDYNLYVDMKKFWNNKLDYIELQSSEFSGYKLINNSLDYYIGISEYLLKYLDDFDYDTDLLCLSHKELHTLSTIEFYNPLNFTVDLKYKDFVYYVKISKEYEYLADLLKKDLKYNIIKYLFVRMIFPFDYFYEVSKVLVDKEYEEKILNIVSNIEQYNDYILYIENMMGIYLFDFIKKE